MTVINLQESYVAGLGLDLAALRLQIIICRATFLKKTIFKDYMTTAIYM